MRITAALEQQFSNWQRGLTLTDRRNQSVEDVAERQQQLIEAVKGGSADLATYLRERLGISADEELDLLVLPRAIAHSEFRDPPFQLERELVEAWANQVHPREASQALFWTICHLGWIEEGQLGEQLDEALLGSIESGAEVKTEEAAVRNLLRRMGGLPHVRGKVSVLNDCPLSRAWWRGRLAVEAAASCDNSFDAETAHRVLHATNDAWARLVGDSVRRITVINHARIRSALIYQYRQCSRGHGGVPASEMQLAVRSLARHGPALQFDLLDWPELLELSADAVARARAEAAAAGTDESTEQDAGDDNEAPNQPSWRSKLPKPFRA